MCTLLSAIIESKILNKATNGFVGFQVLTAVFMKSYIFWDITQTLLLASRCFLAWLIFRL
jgi:hypothetical protein